MNKTNLLSLLVLVLIPPIVQVTAAKLSLTLTSELIREGKPSDSDMMSQVCHDDDDGDDGDET